jgi:acylphosphatase
VPPPDTALARQRYEGTVHGRVQGVGFRWFVRSAAARLDLCGWVANEPSGSVRVVAEGDPDNIAELVRALGHGPPGAHVERVDGEVSTATGAFSTFEIRSGGHPGD